MRLLLAILFAVTSLAGLAAETGTGFKRVVFDTKVPLGDEAPGVVADDKVAAFVSGRELQIVALDTGERLASRKLPIPDTFKGDVVAQALGIHDKKIYGYCFYYNEERLDPQGGTARVGGGAVNGRIEVFECGTDNDNSKVVCEVPYTAKVADNLLGNALVFVDRHTLFIKPLTGAAPMRSFDLRDDPQRRPTVSHGEIFGLSQQSIYYMRPDEKELHIIPYSGSALSALVEGDGTAAKSGDLILVSSVGVSACDLTGKLRWKVPVSGIIATGSEGEICVVDYSTVYRIDRNSGRILWAQYLPPMTFSVNANECYGAVVCADKLVVPAEHILSVYDMKSGGVLMNLCLEKELVRRSYNIHTPLMKLIGTKTRALIGFEDSVYALDLMPVLEVPEALQPKDNANASRRIDTFLQMKVAPGPYEKEFIGALNDLADTPGKGAALMPFVRQAAGANFDLLLATHWIREPEYVEVLLKSIAMEPAHQANEEFVKIIACNANRELAQTTLKGIVNHAEKYSESVREVAAQQLRLRPADRVPGANDYRELLYGGDEKAAIASISAMLISEKEVESRQSLLTALKEAPDEVLCGLAETAAKLPEAEGKTLLNMITAAGMRLNAIAKFQIVK